MRFAVGYQLAGLDAPSWIEVIADYRQHIAEVYFAPPGTASGRPMIGMYAGRLEADAVAQYEDDLRALRQIGVKLDVLFNANCYGEHAISTTLEKQVTGELDRIADAAGRADIVTTTSPAVAHIVRRYDPAIEIRASVNMRIGTIAAMDCAAHLFDSYYIQRDMQRNIAYVRRLHDWAQAHGKHLCMLGNSGCLAFCPAQVFHDNLMAHEAAANTLPSIADFNPYLCRTHLANPALRHVVMQATWVRPEDLHHYQHLVDVVKLATRTHPSPRLVVDAYARGRFHGNLLELLEPGHASLFAPAIIDNDAVPADFFQRTSTCGRQCERCDYCRRAMDAALVCADDTCENPTTPLTISTPHQGITHEPGLAEPRDCVDR